MEIGDHLNPFLQHLISEPAMAQEGWLISVRSHTLFRGRSRTRIYKALFIYLFINIFIGV